MVQKPPNFCGPQSEVSADRHLLANPAADRRLPIGTREGEMRRRLFMRASAAAPLALAAVPAAAQAPSGGGKIYVLVHGSWVGRLVLGARRRAAPFPGLSRLHTNPDRAWRTQTPAV